MGRALNEIALRGSVQTERGDFSLTSLEDGRAQRFSMRAQSAGLFSKQARKWPMFAWKTPKTQIFSDAGSFVAFSKSSRRGREPCDDGKLTRRVRRRGSLATASGGTSWRDAVGGGGRGGRACARGVVPAASRASARFVRGTARRARSRRRHVEERQRRRARGDARHGARCFGRGTAVGGPRASRSRALGDARARRETV